jgi:hypothetical protein
VSEAEPFDLDMGAAPASPRRRRRLRRAARIGTAIAIVLFAAAGIVWSQRRPIADGFIRDALVQRGVPARYKVAEIGLRTQRITDLVLGDPANPDLTADWVELDLSLGFRDPEVVAVRAGAVRMRGRVKGGTLSLGALDRLLPAPSGKPFALPAIALAIADGRARIDTDQGQVGIKLTGSGRLDDGFRGRIAAVAPRVSAGPCQAIQATLYGDLRILARQPHFDGPVRVRAGRCDSVTLGASSVALKLALDERLDRWRGEAGLALGAVSDPRGSLGSLAGTIRFDGGPRATGGSMDLVARKLTTAEASAGQARLIGQYRIGQAQQLDARVTLDRVRASEAMRRSIAAVRSSGAGTPVGPLIDKLAGALVAMAGDAGVAADLALATRQGTGSALLRRMTVNAASGAQLSLTDGAGARFGWPSGGLTVNGLFAIGGGGLPQGLIRLSQALPGGPVTGEAMIAPYRAGDASLALNRVAFELTGGRARMTGAAVLSGPLPGGRIDGLSLPVDARFVDGRITVNPGCAPLAFDRLTVSSLTLTPARLTLCPTDGAMLRMADGRIAGGVSSDAIRLAGTLGGAPLTVDAARGRYDLAANRFVLDRPMVAIGAPDRINRFAAETLDGTLAGGAVSGSFAGLGGQIARVPLILSDGAGEWRFADAALTLDGGLTVGDDVNAVEPGQPPRDPRFNPMVSNDVRLTLADSRILATGTLHLPGRDQTIAAVTIRHDLSRTVGDAVIDVPGVRFAETGLQPRDLTELAFGVVAAVNGTVSGRGTIDWTADGVTSGGTFRTDSLDLAAAFGPVTGLSGEIRFSDLLSLETAPGQVVKLTEVNPGFPVRDGEIRYRLLAGQKVAIEGGRWPLAGGTMVLEPTVLDFASTAPKRMVFRAEGVDADQFLQQFDFDNLDATGTFDGVIPVLFDASGARVEGGRLAVRQGGGTLAYLGELSEEQLGAWGDFAFQALRAIRYRELELALNGPLAGDMITEIRFAGVAQGEGTKSNFLIRRLARLPLVFNIRIQAPFLQLIDSARSIYDPSNLDVPSLLREQAAREAQARGEIASPKPPQPDIQPPESEKMP